MQITQYFQLILRIRAKKTLEMHTQNYLKTKDRMKMMLDMISKMKVAYTNQFRDLIDARDIFKATISTIQNDINNELDYQQKIIDLLAAMNSHKK